MTLPKPGSGMRYISRVLKLLVEVWHFVSASLQALGVQAWHCG